MNDDRVSGTHTITVVLGGRKSAYLASSRAKLGIVSSLAEAYDACLGDAVFP